ncbi:MAG: TetR/AcrR family transcriptional regulator, partial [Actinomycetota bacterium]|nr:TetR/AcrR family transcriptional regulator [Actinomycetota bacterium]
MDAALRVFAEHGFHKATIKRIAGQAHLRSPALIYWYFTDKVDLFRAAI